MASAVGDGGTAGRRDGGLERKGNLARSWAEVRGYPARRGGVGMVAKVERVLS